MEYHTQTTTNWKYEIKEKTNKQSFLEKILKKTILQRKKVLKRVYISQPMNFQHLIHWPCSTEILVFINICIYLLKTKKFRKLFLFVRKTPYIRE